MMMNRTVSVILFFAMLALHRSLAEDSPTASPAPAPVTGADDFSPPAPAPTPDTPSRTPPQDASSPPSPPPSDLGSQAPSPADANTSAPASDSEVAKDVRQAITSEEKSSGRGKKVGIAVGVVAGACVVVLGALVYKKRRDNIRRSQYGQDARGSLL